MSATTIAGCGSGSVIPESRNWCSRYVLSDFAKSERALGRGAHRRDRRQRRTPGARPGLDLPEQGPSRDGRQRFRRSERIESRRQADGRPRYETRDIMGFKCGIVGLPNVGKSTLFNALTQTAAAQAANYPFCTIEPNVGEIAVPDPRLDELARLGEVAADRSDAADVRRHRGPGARRLEGRRARQPVPRQHPRDRRDRACGALLQGRRRHPRRRQDRSGRRHRDDRDRADARRSRQPGEARRRAREEGEGQRQGGEGVARPRQSCAGAVARRQAGAHRSSASPRRNGRSACSGC